MDLAHAIGFNPDLRVLVFTTGVTSAAGLFLGGLLLLFTIPVNVVMAQELAPAQVAVQVFFEQGGVIVTHAFLPTKSATLGKTAADIARLRDALWGAAQPGLSVCRTSAAGGRSYLLPEKPSPEEFQRRLAELMQQHLQGARGQAPAEPADAGAPEGAGKRDKAAQFEFKYKPREVKDLVLDYLEACQERGILQVRIIHGKGIGNLRRTVHSILSQHSEVVSFTLDYPQFGGWGATLVQLRPRQPPEGESRASSADSAADL